MTIWIRLGPKANDQCPYRRQKKRDKHRETQGKSAMTTEAEIRLMCLQVRDCQSHQKLGERCGTEGRNPADSLLLASRTENNCLLLLTTTFVVICYSSLEKLIQVPFHPPKNQFCRQGPRGLFGEVKGTQVGPFPWSMALFQGEVLCLSLILESSWSLLLQIFLLSYLLFSWYSNDMCVILILYHSSQMFCSFPLL